MDIEQNEQVIYEGRPSWRSILSFYIMGLILVAIAAAIALLVSGGGLAAAVGAGVFVLLLIIGWLKRISTRYAITDRRLRIQRGPVGRSALCEQRRGRQQSDQKSRPKSGPKGNSRETEKAWCAHGRRGYPVYRHIAGFDFTM